ncbi:SusC/RagA family TonB-linked outer membrane protein [Paraflavitalea soli]|uniref:SusC/RagA family TonB-linked outer membrane protein n=1 Tax=Paraflavitalea soli TaxID=2315862 RepID=A0A3B7MN21_9BACT|nr:SusC/RagA family TonB-linked outer membrane protein [Paraflavitalea soli]AXY74759.1 SusC/RagA family TonB-linked outer membrane protein [Paraflavitalea soli]
MQRSAYGKGLHCHARNVAMHFQRSVSIGLLLLLSIQFLAFRPAGESQVVSLNFKNAPLQKVFNEIRKQTGYTFTYSETDLSKAKPVNISISNIRILDALTLIFQEQPLTYTVIERIIIIKEKAEKKINQEQRSLQSLVPMDVHGRVLNEHNDPVAGVTVRVKGSEKIGTYTDGEGEFVLRNIESNVTLVLTAVNITSIEAKVDGRKYLDLKVMGKTAPLDEVQVIAYGKTSQRFNVGNSATVKAEDIEKQPVKNPLLALQGRVPGLEVTPANGLRGSGVTIRIQGTNSLYSGNDPLILIDGVPYASQTLRTTSVGTILLGNSGSPTGAAVGGAGSPLNYINPSDIESIDVLKDADATAIYGSRAANGAILITTKKGKAGNTQLDLNLSQGWGKVGKFMNVLNTKQYLEMRREAFNNDGVPIPSIITNPSNTNYDVNGHWDTTRDANWQKELIGGTAQYSNVILTVSGGTVNTQFRLSGTYNRMTTVFLGNSGNPSKNLSFSLNNVSLNKRFTLQFSGSYMDDLNTLPGVDFTKSAITLPPNAPALYTSDGSLNWAPNAAGRSSFSNPLTQLDVKYKAQTTNLVANLAMGYKLMDGLELRTSLGYTNQQLNEYMGYPLSIYAPENRLVPDPSLLRAADYSNSNINSWIIEPQLNYQCSFGYHKFNALIGGTAQQRNSNGYSLSGSGYTTDASLEDPKAAVSIRVGSTVPVTYKYVGVFGRLSYSFKDRFLFSLTARRDGSSRFGPANRFHNFGAIGGGWIFSEEGLIRKKLRFLSFGKIRGSYGTTGNDQIGDYVYIPQFAPYSVAVPYQGTAGYSLGGLFNPHLEWEETRKLQIGVDLGFFKDRVLITANYALNRCSNQLMDYNLPYITGADRINYNFPATLQNRSIELAFRSVNYRNANVEWTSNVNITFPENKLLSFPNIETSSYAQFLIIGKSFNVLQLRSVIGVDPLTGIFLLQGKNGPTSNPSEVLPRVAIIEPQQKYSGGFQNNIRYRQLQFGFSFQFVKKLGLKYFAGQVPGHFNRGNGNQPTSVLDRWQKPGDIAEYQKFSQNSSLASIYSSVFYSDYSITNASFIRLNNVSLSCQLPSEWMHKISFRSANLYLHAQNLFTITPYKGWDPEKPGTVALPQLRLITVGIQATL